MKKLFGIRTVAILSFLLLAGLGCKGASTQQLEASKPITLEFWSVAHDSRLIEQYIEAYRARRPYVTIHYRRFRPEEYEQKLIDALAEDRGPDIFTFHNSWTKKYQGKLLPAPAQVEVARVYTKGGQFTKEKVTEIETIKPPTPTQMDQLFMPVVKGDVLMPDEVGNQQLWGLPMALDTLVMFYNQDILDKAGVAQAPTTWGAFQEAVTAVTRYGENGAITQAGAAIGTGANIDRSADIITALMMQNGAEMIDGRGRPAFQLVPPGFSGNVPPGIEALQFYSDFADPTKQVYTYNAQMEQSLDAFARGKAAFFFGYAYHVPLLKARSPKLNYRIVQLPQLNPSAPRNVANYWVEGVSKKTERIAHAWDFVVFLTGEKIANSYTQSTRKPTALRGSLNKQLENPELTPFASQVLTASSWYHGSNPADADKTLAEMIDFIHENTALAEEENIYELAINRAASKIRQSY